MWVLLLSCLFAQVAAHGHLLTPAPRQCKEGGCGGAGYIDDELSPINFNGDEQPSNRLPAMEQSARVVTVLRSIVTE